MAAKENMQQFLVCYLAASTSPVNLVATTKEMKEKEGNVVVMGFLFFHFFMIWRALDFGVLDLAFALSLYSLALSLWSQTLDL